MARKRRSKYLDRSRFYGNWDPLDSSVVWEDNDARAERLADLDYYRKHPTKASLDELFKLLDDFITQWDIERSSFRNEWNHLVQYCREVIDQVNEKTEEIKKLNEVIVNLNHQIEDAYRTQERIQKQIEDINREKAHNRELASKYYNEAVEAYNLIANDISYHRFAGDDLESLRYLLKRMESDSLDDSAIQGLAVEAMTKLYAMQKQVSRKKTEFEIIQAIVKEEAIALKNQYIDWRDHVYFDMEKKNQADLNFWSRGLFSELMQEVENICHEVESAPSNIEIMTDDLNRMRNELQDLKKAGEETKSSVLLASSQSEKAEALANITSIILIEDFFFKVVFMGFNDDDERSSYVVQLDNHASGIRLQFVFTPLSETQIGCKPTVSFRGYHDEKIVSDIMKSIWSELRPNKIRPISQDDNFIVDDIEFVPVGQTFHIDTPTTKSIN